LPDDWREQIAYAAPRGTPGPVGVGISFGDRARAFGSGRGRLAPGVVGRLCRVRGSAGHAGPRELEEVVGLAAVDVEAGPGYEVGLC
jgi:hypothetical protein